MNAEQVERLVNALVDRITSGQPQVASPSPSEAPGRVSWNQLPKLDLSLSAEIDSWFMSFEARMTAARVPEEHWGAKFLECPSVEESLKVRAREVEPYSFFSLRRVILQEHGPIDPVNYFKRELYRVRGTNAEDVREALMKLLMLHNRAARDEGSQQLRERDLCYPFLEAFPVSVKATLERQLALIFAQEQPFEHLYRLAPSKRQSMEECHISQECDIRNNGNEDPEPREDNLAEAVALVLQHFKQGQPLRQDSRKKRRTNVPLFNGNSTPLKTVSGNCIGCGGL